MSNRSASMMLRNPILEWGESFHGFPLRYIFSFGFYLQSSHFFIFYGSRPSPALTTGGRRYLLLSIASFVGQCPPVRSTSYRSLSYHNLGRRTRDLTTDTLVTIQLFPRQIPNSLARTNQADKIVSLEVPSLYEMLDGPLL